MAEQATPSALPGSVRTIAARTAAAAATQTAILIASTETTTLTPSPTGTSSITPTFFFRLTPGTSTPRPPFTTPTSGPAPGELSCKVLSQSLRNDRHFSPRDKFDVGWKVINNGTSAWDPAVIDFAYLSGTKMYVTPRTELPTTVMANDTIALGASIVVPRNTGTYTTVWALWRGKDDFCHVSLRIIVR